MRKRAISCLALLILSPKVVGEAAKNVPEAIRSKYPAIPWKEMAGMRDKVIHFYFGVNREAVWIALKDVTLKMDPLQIVTIRKLATTKSIPYQTLIRHWLADKTRKELSLS